MTYATTGQSEHTGISMFRLFQLFQNDSAAKKWFNYQISSNGLRSPNCQSFNVQANIKHPSQIHRSQDCKKRPKFSDLINRVIVSSKRSVRRWSQSTVWFLRQRLGETEANLGNSSLLSSAVEADKTYIGGQDSYKHEEQNLHMGRGVASVMKALSLLFIFPIIICTALIGTTKFADATNHPFTEVKFAGEALTVREKVIKFRDGDSAFERINIEWRYTKNTYNYWGNTRLNDNLVQGETRNTNNLTSTSSYGVWDLWRGSHRQDNYYWIGGGHFEPSDAAIAAIKPGDRLEVAIETWQDALKSELKIIYIREDINIEWRRGSTGMEINKDGNTTFNWHYADIEAGFDNLSDLTFTLRLKEGRLATISTDFSRSGNTWSLSNAYGGWNIGTFGNCSHNPNVKCARIEYRPNRGKFNATKGFNVRMWVTGTRTDAGVTQSDTIEFNLTGLPHANLAWNTEGAGILRTGGSTTYDNIVGQGTVFKHWQKAITFQAAEKVNEQATEVTGNRTNSIKFNKRQYGSDLTYGSWWVDDQRSNRSTDPINNDYFTAERGFFFEPNSVALNALAVGQTVTSILKFRFHAANSESSEVEVTNFISVTITRLPVVSISVNETTIKEGGEFTFTITVDPAATSESPFEVDIEETEVNTQATPIEMKTSRTISVTAATAEETVTTAIRTTFLHGSIYGVKIKPKSTYTIKGLDTVSVNAENITPSLLSIRTGTTSITEGDSFDFTVTADPVPLTPIPFTLTQNDAGSGYFGSYSVSVFEVPIEGSQTVTVSTNFKIDDDEPKDLQISIMTATPNEVLAPSITVAIQNKILPTVSISSDLHEGTVPEGAGFRYTLTATPPPSNTLEVTLSGTSTPMGYLTNTFEEPIIIRSSGRVETSANLAELGAAVGPGTIVIAISQQTDSYKISTENPQIMVSVSKIDAAERPRVSIVSTANQLSIVEGQSFEVTISADPAPEANLTVELTVLSDGFFAADLLQTVIIPPTGSVDKKIDTEANLETKQEGRIAILLRGNPNYFTSATNNFINITVLSKDIDPTPVVSVTGLSQSITMGDLAEFNITAQPAPTSTLRVNISISYEGNTLLWRGPTKILLRGQNTLSLFTIIDWENLDDPHSVSVKIETGDGYNPAGNGDDTAKIVVDAIESASSPQNLPNIAVANLVAGSLLEMMSDDRQNVSQSQGTVDPPIANAPNITLPKISVVAVFPVVEEGNSVIFNLSGDQNLQNHTAIDYTLTAEGNFFEGLSAEVRTVELTKSQRVSQVKIATIDDSIAEANGALTLTLIKRDGYELVEPFQARVVISDLADQQQRIQDLTSASQDILPDLTGSLAVTTLSIANDRIDQAFVPSNTPVTFMYDGKQDLTDLLIAGGDAINDDSMTLRNVLSNSSFSLSLFPQAEGPSPATIWGIGLDNDFGSSSSDNERSWNGDVFTGTLGLDAMVSETLLAGVSAVITESNVDHSGLSEEGLSFTSRTTALNPYIGWKSVTGDTQIQGITGYGVGEIEIDQTNYAVQTASNTYYTFGVSGDKQIYSSDLILTGGVSELSVIGQGWFARQHLIGIADLIESTQTDASHNRLALRGSHTQTFETGSILQPTFSFGFRGDGRDNQSIFGMEVGTGISYTAPIGLSLSGDNYMFLVEQGEIQKWSLIGSVSYDQNSDSLGTMFEIFPSFGQMNGEGNRSLWSNDILESVSDSGQYMDGGRINTDLSYGFSILGDTSRITPFAGYGYSTDETNRFSLGAKLDLGSDVKFELTGLNETNLEGLDHQKIKLDGTLNW